MNQIVKICVISDTHNHHKKLTLPNADIIVHCGDFTSMGYEHEIKSFMKWYSNLNYKYKIIIAGNHDRLFEGNLLHAKTLIPNNVIYLEDEGVNVMGLNFYGSPVQKQFMNWAFNRTEEKMSEHWKAIPNDTDILITHSPPYMIGDYVPRTKENVGSPSLYNETIKRIKPIASLFGHIHEGRCYNLINNTLFINATNLNGSYHCIHEPIVLEIKENKANIMNIEMV